MVAGTDAAWRAYGDVDPYYGVLTDERFRAAVIDDEARREFFATGESHTDLVFQVLRERMGMEAAPRRALDFGCGVGRVAIPLARRCGEVVGIDVAEGMLAEARRNAAAAGVGNLRLVRAADGLGDETGTFDLIHSYIVFQHVPSRRGEAILRRLLDHLEPGGRAALHFNLSRDASLVRRMVHHARGTLPLVNGVVNLLQGRRWSYPFMRMVSYRPDRLLAAFRAAGCDELHLRLTDHGGFLGAMVFCRKAPAPGF